MRCQRTLLGPGVFFALLVLPPPLFAKESLAARANAIEWEIGMDSSDRFPTALRALQRELIGRGASVLIEIEAGLADSLHLRRIAPGVAGEFPGDVSRRILVELLGSPDEITASEAAFAAGEVGGVELIPALAKALTHASPQVRHDALNSLSGMGAADRVTEEALRLLGDRESFVRHSAASLLQHLMGSHHANQARVALESAIEVETDAGTRQAMVRTMGVLGIRFPA